MRLRRTHLAAGSDADVELIGDALRQVVEPASGRRLGDLDLVGEVVVEQRGRVRFTVHALTSDADQHARLSADAVAAAEGCPGVGEAHATVVPLDDAARARLGQRLRQDNRRPGGLGADTVVYAVGSGKGGVGKSSVTANLAAALARKGQRVGVLDADVWGYSIPQLFGVRRAPVALKGLMLPVEAHGVELMSVGFFVADDEPVVWRGPMLHKAMEQFLDDVCWGSLDVLLVDLPPGTGDVTLSVLELLPDASLLVVTTPQQAATQVAARVGRMALDARMPLAGVVENMSGGAFGSGGGAALATTLDTSLLAQVPLDPALCEAGDSGTPLVLTDDASPAAQEIAGLAERLPVVRRALLGRSLPLFVG